MERGVAQVLALLPHSKKTLGSIPAWVPVCSGWLSRWGLSVWSLHVLPVLACILRISSIRTPGHQKHAERSPVLSLTKMWIMLELAHERRQCQLSTAPGCPLEEGQHGWENAEKTFHQPPHVCAYLAAPCTRVVV